MCVTPCVYGGQMTTDNNKIFIFFYHVGLWDLTQVVGGQCLYLLSHINCP